MLERQDGKYTNTPETDLFLDQKKSSYVGGLLEMFNTRLYPFWGSLTEGLRTGQPQSEAKYGGNFFESLCTDPTRLRQFLSAMTGLSLSARSRSSPINFPGRSTEPSWMWVRRKEAVRCKLRLPMII